MTLSATKPEEHAWIVGRTQCGLTAGARGIKATDTSGAIRGMVVYDAWTDNAAQAHMAADTPLAWRSLIPAVFEYPFLQCKKGVLLGVIPSHNKRSRGMVKRLGFRESHRVRNGWAQGDDLIIYEMTREECRWLARKEKAA